MNRSLEDKAYDLIGEMLLEQEVSALLAEIEEEKASGQTDEMDAFFQQYDSHNLARIDKYFRKQKTKRFFTKTLPKVGQIAAVFIAVISVAGGIAIASSSAVRVRVMQLLVNVEREYTELRLVENADASFDVPIEWDGDYYPSYIPDGLEAPSITQGAVSHSADFFNSTREQNFFFVENGEGGEMNVDTENAEIRQITISGWPGFISVKGDRVNIYWANERRYFLVITAGIDEATAIRVAESVVRVK